MRGHLLELFALLELALAQVDRPLEVLGRDRRLHFPFDLPQLLFELAQVLGVAHPPQLDPGAGLVEHVDRLVGLEAVRDVAVGLVDRGLERGVVVAHLVERLVALLHPDHDQVGLVRAGRIDADRLEAAQQRAVLLDVFAVFLDGGGADAGDLAAREGRLQDVGGVERAFGRAGADQRMDLVDEDDQVFALLELLEDALEPLLELAAVFGAGDDQREVERDDPLAAQENRHLVVDDALRQAFDDRGFADPGLAQQDRVVFGAAGEHLDDAVELFVAADQRVEGFLGGQLGEVPAVFGEEGQLFFCCWASRSRAIETISSRTE